MMKKLAKSKKMKRFRIDEKLKDFFPPVSHMGHAIPVPWEVPYSTNSKKTDREKK